MNIVTELIHVNTVHSYYIAMYKYLVETMKVIIFKESLNA